MLLTTHYLDEAEHLADRVGVIAAGRLLDVDTVDRLGGADAPYAAGAVARGRPAASRSAPTTRRPLVAGPGRAARRRGARPRGAPAEPGGRLPGDDRRGQPDRRRARSPVSRQASRPDGRRRREALRPLAFRGSGIELLEFFREQQALVFIFAFPVVMLVIFASAFGGGTTSSSCGGVGISGRAVLPHGMVATGVMSASFQSLAISIAVERDDGTLKLLRGTPMPADGVLPRQDRPGRRRRP